MQVLILQHLLCLVSHLHLDIQQHHMLQVHQCPNLELHHTLVHHLIIPHQWVIQLMPLLQAIQSNQVMAPTLAKATQLNLIMELQCIRLVWHLMELLWLQWVSLL